MSKNIYYNYIFLDPRKPGKYYYDGLDVCFLYEPFYVGKGKKRRIDESLRRSVKNISGNPIKNNKINSIIKNGYDVIILKIYENLSELESFNNEIFLIKTIGRYDLNDGSLTNVTNGGEGSSGYILSQKTKEKMSKIRKGKNFSEEHKQKISKSKLGKKFSNEHINNLTKAQNKRIRTNEKQNTFKWFNGIKQNHPMNKFLYTLSNNENYWTYFNKKERHYIVSQFKRKKSNIILYKDIIIKKDLIV